MNSNTRPVNAFYNPATGFIKVGNDQVTIARQSDFTDFITEAPKEKAFVLKAALEAGVRQFGAIRSPAADLLRQRLHQLRTYLAA